MDLPDAEAAPQPPRTSRAILLAIAALVVVATAHALLVEPKTHRDPFFDELRYRVYAQNLTGRHFFGDKAGEFPATVELRSVGYRAGVAPGYPFFLAAVRSLFGGGNTPVRVIQALLAGATVGLTSLIGYRLWGPVAGVLAGVLLIATGVIAGYAQFTLSEVLSAATLTAAALLAVVAAQDRSWKLAVAAGLMLGVSAMVRPQVLALPGLLVPWAYFAFGRGKAGRMAAAALAGGFVLAIAPWTIRNAIELHAFVPGSSYTWANLWLANNPGADGLFRRPEYYIGAAEVRRIRSLPELEQDAEWRRMALDWVKKHPGDAMQGWLRNGRVFLTNQDRVMLKWYAIRGGISGRLDERYLIPAAIGAAVLAAAAGRFARGAWVPLLVVAYSMLFFCFFLPEPRYRVAMVPMLAALAGALPVAVAQLARHLSDRSVGVST